MSHPTRPMTARIAGAVLVAALVPLFGYVGAILCADLGASPQASATPKPGDPGGNHSKPGDNKKKNKDSGNKNRSSGSDHDDNQSTQNQRPGQSGPQAQVGNGRSTSDGPNRTVQITGGPSQPEQSPHRQAPQTVIQPPPATTQAAPPTGQSSPAPQIVPAQQQTTTQQPPVAVTTPTNGSSPNDTTGAVVLGTAALAGALSRRYSGARTLTPENLGKLLGAGSPTERAPQTVAPLNLSGQDVDVLRQVMLNDDVPAGQIDSQVNAVVGGAQQLNTAIATGQLPPVPQPPSTPQPAPGFADGFRDTWNGSVQAVNNLLGLGGPKEPGVLESWSSAAQGLNETITNPVGSVVEQFNNAPSAAYFFGQNAAQLAQQAPLAMLGPETLAVRAPLVTGAQIGGLDAASQLLIRSEAVGGHLLARHVGLADAELSARLAANPTMSAASTFQSFEEASAVTNVVLQRNAAAIQTWLDGGAALKLQLDAPVNSGLVLLAGADEVLVGTSARLVLKGTGSGGFFVLTGFPKP